MWDSRVSLGFFHVYDLKSVPVSRAKRGSPWSVIWYCLPSRSSEVSGFLDTAGWVEGTGVNIMSWGRAWQWGVRCGWKEASRNHSEVTYCRGPHSAVPRWFHVGMVGDPACENKGGGTGEVAAISSDCLGASPSPQPSLPAESLKVWRTGHPGMSRWKGWRYLDLEETEEGEVVLGG